eukprot:TRINITY_DN6591_c1_g1_i1.p1 TRINITY_DN6591_c1_g1~~TRINITY_DN6591_c1_g1_i1.p1  ORF type:complete len:1166 (-),score=200.90 TRINITY_DN6591_c1_g1_i1:144-3548(-)
MVEILAAIGLGAKELFTYNRESYKFDQDQRLERELLRMEMQVKRFELFREDVRDLVELTVGRMDVYHLVGALFLEFCVSFFCEGRVQANAPPFILSLFLLSNACAFVYLLLAVWLSMHASIASHSFGVRLLTRFVRLPIPSPQQITSLSSRLADFEAQGLSNVLRLPAVQKTHEWQSPEAEAQGSGAADAPSTAAEASGAGRPALEASSSESQHPMPSTAPQSFGPQGSASQDVRSSVLEQNVYRQEDQGRKGNHLLGNGEMPFIGEDALLRPAGAPGLHVQLFRRLQAKWQCYDAYCRVCMALGVNQILQGLSYYSIVHTLVENRSPSCGYALLFIFQAAAFAIAVLDISGLRRRALLAVQAVGTLPALLAAQAVHMAERDEGGGVKPGEMYWTSPAMFLLQACWLELLLWVAAPSTDECALPRRFRTVLFLDVFGDGADPTDAEYVPPEERGAAGGHHWGTDEERLLIAERVAGAEVALAIAQSAMRRWEAAPSSVLAESQHAELQRLRVELQIWRRALKGELAWRAASRGMPHESNPFGEDTIRPWGELSPVEQQEDPFKDCLLGPFEHDMGYETTTYYYDIENVRYYWETPGSRPTLTLAAVAAAVRGLEAAMRLLLAMTEIEQAEAEDAQMALGDGINEGPEAFSPLESAVLGDSGALSLPQRLLMLLGSSVRLGRRIRDAARGISGIELSQPLMRRQVSADSQDGRPETRSRSPPGTHCHLAGPNAKHFVPERLPWQVLRGVTRMLQIAWGFTGMMAVLRELGIYRIDFQQHPGGERRLRSTASEGLACPQRGEDSAPLPAHSQEDRIWLRFDALEVQWPHGAFFQPEVLSLMKDGEEESSLLIGSPFSNYRLRGLSKLDSALQPLKLEELFWQRDLSPPLPGAVSLCGRRGRADGCFLGRASQEEAAVTLWSFSEHLLCQSASGSSSSKSEVTLSLLSPSNGRTTRPWQLLAGTVVSCRLLDGQAASNASSCLALAGWDGLRLVVAPVPLHDGPCQLPAHGTVIRPRFSVPLNPASGEHATKAWAHSGSSSDAVVALSLAILDDGVHTALRLRCLQARGTILTWDLQEMQALRRMQVQMPEDSAADFQVSSLVEDLDEGILFVAGWGTTGSGPRLLQTRLPGAMETG